MPDFFLDEGMEYAQQKFKSTSTSSPASKNTPAGVFEHIKPLISEDAVKQIGASYLFALSGENAGFWILDLKTGGGSVGEASENTKADVTFKMDSKDMVNMFQGKLVATTAFMTGKMRISGDMGSAMKLQKLMKQVQSKL